MTACKEINADSCRANWWPPKIQLLLLKLMFMLIPILVLVFSLACARLQRLPSHRGITAERDALSRPLPRGVRHEASPTTKHSLRRQESV